MIDWTKPLELIDGTPVRLERDPETGETNYSCAPDKDGDYWIEREDGGRYVSVDPKAKMDSYAVICVHPNGCEEGTHTVIVRNREQPA